MGLNEYTPTSICQALGLDGFRSTAGRDRMLTLLLCPSFAPEICIRVSSDQNKSAVDLHCAKTQFWTRQYPGPIPTIRETAVLELSVFAGLEDRFRRALAAPDCGGVVLDGMPVHVEWRIFSHRIIVEDFNSSREGALRDFVAQTIQQVFVVAGLTECRNALAEAARYVGLDLPIEERPERDPPIQVGVLGDADERAEVLAVVRAAEERLRIKSD